MRFSPAYSHTFALGLKYSPDYPVLKDASCKIYTIKKPPPPPIIKWATEDAPLLHRQTTIRAAMCQQE